MRANKAVNREVNMQIALIESYHPFIPAATCVSHLLKGEEINDLTLRGVQQSGKSFYWRGSEAQIMFRPPTRLKTAKVTPETSTLLLNNNYATVYEHRKNALSFSAKIALRIKNGHDHVSAP